MPALNGWATGPKSSKRGTGPRTKKQLRKKKERELRQAQIEGRRADEA